MGDVCNIFRQEINHDNVRDVEETYIKIDYQDLITMNLGERLGLITENEANNLLQFKMYPEIHCIRGKFPHAHVMNYGPNAADGRKHVRDYDDDYESQFSPTAPRYITFFGPGHSGR